MVNLPRVSLCCLPTPLHRLPRLSEKLQVDLWIKRDDLTGFAASGNKGRKIEFLLGDVLAKGAHTVVCQGARQSNFIRQLGAACRMHGITCHAVVMDMPYYEAAGKPTATKPQFGGNLILDELFGVELHAIPDGDWETLAEATHALAQELRQQGQSVYEIAIGGSSTAGAYSFYLAGEEATSQEAGFDWLVTPSSSGSTHAGLAAYFARTSTRVIGISADPDPDYELADDVFSLTQAVAEHLGHPNPLNRTDIDLRLDYCGEAYGIPSPEGQSAQALFAEHEGIILDPVYTAKAAGGLINLIERKEIGGKVLFWHTGGLPVVFTHG